MLTIAEVAFLATLEARPERRCFFCSVGAFHVVCTRYTSEWGGIVLVAVKGKLARKRTTTVMSFLATLVASGGGTPKCRRVRTHSPLFIGLRIARTSCTTFCQKNLQLRLGNRLTVCPVSGLSALPK